MQKRSIAIEGHRTSVALEPAFWRALEALAAARGLSLQALVAKLDAERVSEGPRRGELPTAGGPPAVEDQFSSDIP